MKNHTNLQTFPSILNNSVWNLNRRLNTVTEDGVIQCANDISEKFKRIRNGYNIALQNNATKSNSSPRTA
jgi:hypothetical protein